MERKEAIEVIKKNWPDSSFTMLREALETLIPELKESEDERIRKELLNYLYDVHDDDEERARWIAWLEKQGEQKLTYKIEPKFKVKYADSEYNVFETKDIAGVTFYGIEDEPNHIDYVKADNCEIISGGYGIKENGSPYPTKPAVFSEQKPAWSEEDEAIYYGVIETEQYMLDVVNGIKKFAVGNISIKEECTRELNWLKLLKERVQPQPKQEWSEEDEAIKKKLISYLAKKKSKETDGYAIWLKSLKDRVQPQNKWKPSDGDNLPEFEREVIVLHQPNPLKLEKTEYCVSFAHRPNPKGWDGKSMLTGKIEHYQPKTYDKGGWNIPNVKWWLDCLMPKEIEL